MDEPEKDPLLTACSLLNRHGARYLVVGGHALILHGLVRTTEDVDILIEESEDNYRRIITALSELQDHAAAELTIQDFIEHVVIKVADEIEVDISRRAWTLSYEQALPGALRVEMDGVTIPYVGLHDLIETKKTYREKDRADLEHLNRLAQKQPPPG